MSISNEYEDRALEPMRASVIQRIQYAFAQGQLEVEELESRLERASSARDPAELRSLVSDLPVRPPEHPLPVAQKRRNIVAIMSGVSRAGRWQPAEHIRNTVFMGGVELDFREAILPLEGITIDIFCVMGGVEITVPPDVTVDVNGFAFMGAFEDKCEGDPVAHPQITVRGFCMMGGVEVRTRERKKRKR